VSCESTDYPWHLDWLRRVLTPTGSAAASDVGGARWIIIIVGGRFGDERRPRDLDRVRMMKPLCCAPPPLQMQGGRWSNNPTPRHLEVDRWRMAARR
jgi:hypothetical protein